MTLFDFLATFFVPVLIVALGLVFAFMGYLFAFARTEGDDKAKTQRVFGTNIPIVRVSRERTDTFKRFGWVMLVVSLLGSVSLAVFLLLNPGNAAQPPEPALPGGIALAGMKYMSA